LYPFAAVALFGGAALGRNVKLGNWREWSALAFTLEAYLAWSVASATWSAATATSSLQSLIGVGVAAFAAWFGLCLSWPEQVWSLAAACTAVVAASALVIVILPQQGRMLPDVLPNGYWQGIFGNRNSLAPVCALGLIVLLGLLMLKPTLTRALAIAPFIVLHAVVLRGSGGSTALAGLAAAATVLALAPVTRAIRRATTNGALVGGVTAALAVAVIGWGFRNLDRVSEALSGDSTLTGRREIWREVRSFISREPVLGYGYWAFWERQDLTSASYTKLNSAYASAHNSMLEVMLGLGVIGLILYLAMSLLLVVGAAESVWRRGAAVDWWWTMILVFVIVQNLTESFVLWHSYLWVLFIAAGFAGLRPTGDELESRRQNETVDLSAGSAAPEASRAVG
jgi:O-antigen ligase